MEYTRAELNPKVSDDEDEGDDNEEAVEDAQEELVKATTSKSASGFVIWKDSDSKAAAQEGAEKKTSNPKRAPLGPKRIPSPMPSRFV